MQAHFRIFVILLCCFGCRSKSPTEEVHELAKWNGKPVSEIRNHPYFRNLPARSLSHEDGSKSLVLTDQSKFQTGAYCQSLGGCIGMPTYNCQHIVRYKNDVIMDVTQNGTCPASGTTSP